MAEIEIVYYGHSCFKISYLGNSVVLDPYEDDSVPGLKLPKGMNADAVYCSHEHKNHHAESLVHTTGFNPFPLFRASVPHDDAGGSKRGFSDMTFLKVGTITIVHMGDIGREPSEEEYEALQRADVLMIPAGGYYTIDAAMAEKITEKVGARLNILMHYRKGEKGYDVLADIDTVAKSFPQLQQLQTSRLVFDEMQVPQKTVTLEPVQ